ncbi:VirB4 family type IV secretion system protein [Macrococcoides caseolyticum]|uniref:VirB4 family type IV secretion system protein n=1 Tax=Macrococcoides caseolyticum TaxID=69966 RepID=UPI0024BBF561|nr:hypothetical protein [Macrococcus caseolyticus]MDJ1089882.1 hypothetical protein [Macrococcus caseolyticus]
MFGLKKKDEQIVKQKIDDFVEDNYDLEFIAKTQPQGGISFHENYIKKGDGYEACLTIYDYPSTVYDNWMRHIVNREGVITIQDISTANREQVQENLKRSLSEQSARIQDNKADAMTKSSSTDKYQTLLGVSHMINDLGEQIKKITVRMFIYKPTLEQLDNEIHRIRVDLEARGIKSQVMNFETKENWQSLVMKYGRQKQVHGVNFKEGQQIPASTLGGGYPFDHTSINDEHGAFIGTTETGGPVYLDLFKVDNVRKSFNSIVFGMMGSGKSTFLKVIEEEQFARNHFIRGFDKAGDFRQVVREQGGKMISLDGSQGMINMLEILPTATYDKEDNPDIEGYDLMINEEACYTQHLSKLQMQMSLMNGDLTDTDLMDCVGYFNDFYIHVGLWTADRSKRKQMVVTGHRPEEYPILSEFRAFIHNLDESKMTSQKRVTKEKILTTLDNMINVYGGVFDGHTTVPNMDEEQIVFYNIEQLEKLSPNVFKCQLYVALSLIWSQALKNGKKYKKMIEDGKIDPRNARRFMVFIDECQNIVNVNNLNTVEFVVNFMKEMRKYLAGVIFATQSPKQLLPENSNNDATTQLKQIFALTQYKFFFQIDRSDIDSVRDVLGETIKESEYEIIPTLGKGEAIVSIQGANNTLFHNDVSEEQLRRFSGGQ